MQSKKDDEELSTTLVKLDTASVLQECRIFNSTPINATKCKATLCKLLYLLHSGEIINRIDATNVFFAITRLFQSKNKTLRLLVFLAIKELCPFSDDVIIVISSLTKDMTGKEIVYRAPAIRALCRIIDVNLLQSIERYMKQAIVDKNPAISSAALVSSLHLMRKNPEVTQRWLSEIQQAISSENYMVQFHALGLFYQIRSSDRLAISKLVQKFSKPGLRSHLAMCYLIRIAVKLIEAEGVKGSDGVPFAFVEKCLRHRSEMVMYEAVLAIIQLPEISGGNLASAVKILQRFCASPKPPLRFVAVRTLNKIALNYPKAVISCTPDLEHLINDQNRSIATLALTVLLKIGSEDSVERLMKQISVFVFEISDEFKVVVIDAIRSLCARYPQKHEIMMIFLASMLRREGSFQYKKALIDTITAIIEENSEDTRESGMLNLCEFIEDCEHISLATRVLHLLGREGPTSKFPERYIRFIYNRVMLEAVEIRAAAITTLAKFGAGCIILRPRIITLLKRCLLDTDDEVRDRATFYLALLYNAQSNALSNYVINALQVSEIGLERTLNQYMKDQSYEKSFDLKQVPLSAEPITSTDHKPPTVNVELPVHKKESQPLKHSQSLSAIPEFSDLGQLFRSVRAVELSEAVTEYNVSCIKHIFQEHIVLQFDCRNTLHDQLLEKVSVDLKPIDEDEGWNIISEILLKSLPYSQPGSTYLLLSMPEDGVITGSFSATLKFHVRDIDPATGEPECNEVYEDNYALENLEITLADHIQAIPTSNFSHEWEQIGETNEFEETYVLSKLNTIPDAVKTLHEFLGLAFCEHSDKVPAGKSSHTLLMSGVFRSGHDILARIRLALDPESKHVTMNISVRSDDKTLSELVGSAIA